MGTVVVLCNIDNREELLPNMSRWFLVGRIFVSECKCCEGVDRRQPLIQSKARFGVSRM